MTSKKTNTILAALVLAAFSLVSTVYAGTVSGAVYTTNSTGTAVNWNIYATNTDVYISGGPQNMKSAGISPDGVYFFQVTDPSGKILLSTDPVACRQVTVSGGRIIGAAGGCPHVNGTFNPANGSTPVRMFPFSPSPNPGGEYKVWLSMDTSFANKNSKTDNFMVAVAAPQGSCAASGSLSVLVSGTNVASYVAKGSWGAGPTGISVVTVEGSNTLPTINPIPTANVVNSCASNPFTGATVCTANNTDVYVISGLAATPTVTTLTSGGSGSLFFSGSASGSPTNAGVAMDALHNKAVIGLSIPPVSSGLGTPGFQFLDGPGSTNTLEPPFASPAGVISEGLLIDPFRNLVLSAAETNNYELVNVATSLAPTFFENTIPASGGEPDSSGEDCTTGIALAPIEFTSPSNVFLANLSSLSATFTPGSPGTWTAPSQNQSLADSLLGTGVPAVGGIAVAQGTHTGIVAQEFGSDALTAIALPTTLDTSGTTPAIGDWVTCNIGSGFVNGLDPHAVTAYQSPTSGDAIAVLANSTATTLAVVDLTKMLNPLIVPRTGNKCTTSPLPGSVVSFIAVP